MFARACKRKKEQMSEATQDGATDTKKSQCNDEKMNAAFSYEEKESIVLSFLVLFLLVCIYYALYIYIYIQAHRLCMRNVYTVRGKNEVVRICFMVSNEFISHFCILNENKQSRALTIQTQLGA